MAQAAAGAVFRIAGGITGGIAADQRRERYENMMRSLPLADTNAEEQKWFDSLGRHYDEASALSSRARSDELTQNLALREQALPGITEGTRKALGAVLPLAAGEMPPWLQQMFQMSAGASVDPGFRGTGAGSIFAGWGGVDRAMQAQTQGVSLLGALLRTMPSVSAPTTMGLLGGLLNPQQRLDHIMRLRQQQIGMTNTLEEMPTALDAWSAHLNESGSMLMGGGGAGFAGIAGGGSSDESGGGGRRGTMTTYGDTMGAAGAYNMNAAKGQAAGLWGTY